MLQVERFPQQCRKNFFLSQSRNKLNMFNLLRLCRKDVISFDIVVKNGNNIEATFDFVKRTIFCDKLVRHCCRFWQQIRMLLRQSCLLLRRCCWCGRGLTIAAPGTLRRSQSKTEIPNESLADDETRGVIYAVVFDWRVLNKTNHNHAPLRATVARFGPTALSHALDQTNSPTWQIHRRILKYRFH